MSTPLRATPPPTPKEAADVLRDFADRVESGEVRIMAVSASYEHAPVEYSSLTINFTRAPEPTK